MRLDHLLSTENMSGRGLRPVFRAGLESDRGGSCLSLAGVEESYWVTVVSIVVVWCVLLGSLAATGPLCVGGVVAWLSPGMAARCLLVRGGCPGGVVV